jgi:hypothetical protein
MAAVKKIGPGSGMAWSIGAGDVVYLYFLDAPLDLPGPSESIRGRPVWRAVAQIDSGAPFRPGVERTKRDDENWIALARPDLMILTNNRNLLSNVLDRILDGSQTRALPLSLPEWKQVDRRAPFWALRHYASSSKPRLGQPEYALAELPRPDGRATGVTVQFYSAEDRLEVRYMSAAQLASRGPTDSIYSQFKVDQPQTGVWRLVSDVRERGSWPLFLALGMLGFGTYQ